MLLGQRFLLATLPVAVLSWRARGNHCCGCVQASSKNAGVLGLAKLEECGGLYPRSLCLFGLLKSFGASSRAGSAPRVQRPFLTKVQESLAGKPYEQTFFQKGVNFTAEWPDTYGSDGALHMLARLPRYGVNAIALVPFGFTRRGSTEVRFGGGWESDSGIEQVAAFAHSLGIKVMLKPQIWVRPGYPGDLEFTSETERRTWFAEYQRFMEHYAGLAKRIHADLLCVGVEFARLTRHEAEWRRLIARARELYPGPLVYAANAGEEFENLRFWDALDYIGLDNYYSLPDDLNVSAIVEKVEAIHRRYQRPVIFTEVGFSSLEAPIASRGMKRRVAFRPKSRLAAMKRYFKRSIGSLGFRGCIGGRWEAMAMAGAGRHPYALGQAGHGSSIPLVSEAVTESCDSGS